MLVEQDLKSIRKKMFQDFFRHIRLLKKMHDQNIAKEELKIDYISLMSECMQCFKDMEIIKKRAIMVEHKKVIALLKEINNYEYKKEEAIEEEDIDKNSKKDDLDPLMSLCILSVADMAIESMEYAVYKTFSKGNIEKALEQCFFAIDQKATDKEKSSMRLA